MLYFLMLIAGIIGFIFGGLYGGVSAMFITFLVGSLFGLILIFFVDKRK